MAIEGEVRIIGDRHDHRGDGHRHDLGVPGLVGQQANHGHGQDDQPADGGDMPQVARDCRLVPVDIVSREQEEGGHQGQDPQGPPGTVAQSQRALGELVLHPQQDELLFADRLSLLDQDVALGVRYRSARPPGFWPRHAAAP